MPKKNKCHSHEQHLPSMKKFLLLINATFVTFISVGSFDTLFLTHLLFINLTKL